MFKEITFIHLEQEVDLIWLRHSFIRRSDTTTRLIDGFGLKLIVIIYDGAESYWK